jgi:uncharacterized membrane protein (UPF0127 family)
MTTRRIRLVRPVALIVATLALLAAPLLAQAAPPPAPWFWTLADQRQVVEITVGDQTLAVEISDTPALHQRGLSYHAPLTDQQGMLFVYDQASPRSYWMKGMLFCLDIVWVEAGQIVGAAESVCPEPGKADQDLSVYRSGVAVSYVLEVRAGWLADHGYGPGTPVDLSAYEDQPGA